MTFLKKIYWFITDKCTGCGGELNIWDIKKAYCLDCGAQN
jgi:hypothetical protein